MKYGKKFLTEYLNVYLSNNRDGNFLLEYIEKVPKKLYRFRECTEKDFSAIRDNYIWLSLGSEFNDIKDSTIKLGFSSQKEDAQRIVFDWYLYSIKKDLKKRYPKMDLSWLNRNRDFYDEYQKNAFNKQGMYSRVKLKRYILSKGMKGSDFEIIDNIFQNQFSKETIAKGTDNLYARLTEKIYELKDYYYVTCFTQSFNNDNLWETYSKKYAGFCIEYDLSQLVNSKNSNLLFEIAPMIYGNKDSLDFVNLLKIAKMEYCKEDFDKILAKDVDFQLNLQVRTKSKTYNHEKEWRLYQKKDFISNRKFHFPYISRVILGKDMKPKNIARIVNISRRNNFEVYQQKFNVLTSSFSYHKLDKHY